MKFGKHESTQENGAGSALFEFSNGYGLSVLFVTPELGEELPSWAKQVGNYEVCPVRFGVPAFFTQAHHVLEGDMYENQTAANVEALLDYVEVASTYEVA